MDSQGCESFSDGVFAVAMTVLVFNSAACRELNSELADDPTLLHHWPAYPRYGCSLASATICGWSSLVPATAADGTAAATATRSFPPGRTRQPGQLAWV